MPRWLTLFLVAGCLWRCGAATRPVSVPSVHDAGVAQSGKVADAGSLVDAGPADAGQVVALADGGGVDPLIAERPYRVVVPPDYRESVPTPVVILLHGYSATAQSQDDYLELSLTARARGFLLAMPEGTKDALGLQFWNATDACCGFGAAVDDVAYLVAVIGDLQRQYNVDSKRIYLFGHSNGAFMAHRFACDHAELIAGIAAFAGDVWNDPSKCRPREPVAVLQIHGTLDSVIRYLGGTNRFDAAPYPAAETSVETWSVKNGCAGGFERLAGDLDLTSEILYPETWRRAYSACPANGAAELWTMWGASHIPFLKSDFSDRVYQWLRAHPKP